MSFNISVVIPVYLGEQTLGELVEKIAPLVNGAVSPDGRNFRIMEVIMVHDCGPDRSDKVIEEISQSRSFVKPVWLSRNFGQHAATLAGMAATKHDWVVTLDEDCQHNPLEIGKLVDEAVSANADIVYGVDANTKIHGLRRSVASRSAKFLVGVLMGSKSPLNFSSFRLIDGSIARGISAYAGDGVYLDVALGWLTDRVATCKVSNELEMRNKSGYSLKKLLSHFLRLILSGGTRPLRIVTISGISIAITGICYAGYVVVGVLVNGEPVAGWTSVIVSILLIGGLVLISLGVIAEYIGLAVRAAFGKPSYFVRQNRKVIDDQMDLPN